MDIEMILAFLFIITVVAIVGGTLVKITGKVVDYKKARYVTGIGRDMGETQGLRERTHYLEERVKVLERIATEKDDDLALEIERLRGDTPRLEGRT